MAKKKTRAAKSAPPPGPAGVPDDQWDLPVSFDPRGGWVTLRQLVSAQAPALSFAELSPQQQSELVAERIARQPAFKMVMIGVGELDQQRAIQEVHARSPAGRSLIEIEQRMIRRMIERAGQGGS